MKLRQTVGPNIRRMTRVFFLAAVLALSGCATPVGVRPLDVKEANRRLTETVLSDDQLSAPTLQILNRAGLEKQFQSEPAEVIAALHQALPTAREADRLFALAELSFLHATKSGDRSYFLAAAVYAYAFLFPQDSGASPDPFDPRFRTAVDLYNRGVSAHSIIAVANPEDPKAEWDDGVVPYSSAHIDGVASELVVHSGHSAQDSPQAIEEVRRILLENLKD